jgi:hypothetical protein
MSFSTVEEIHEELNAEKPNFLEIFDSFEVDPALFSGLQPEAVQKLYILSTSLRAHHRNRFVVFLVNLCRDEHSGITKELLGGTILFFIRGKF